MDIAEQLETSILAAKKIVMEKEVRRYSSLEKLSRECAKLICKVAQECVKDVGTFTLVLSGGKTPRTLYGMLAQEPFMTLMPWFQTHIFWGDERAVPLSHPDSNFAMAFQTFLKKVPIPFQNIHRILVELKSHEEGAAAYAKMLKNFFQLSSHKNPSFDLILLGMGSDGHTASLFPGDPVLKEKVSEVAAVHAPVGFYPNQRITLTLPVINAAQRVWFLVSEVGKKKILTDILDKPQGVKTHYPAGMVHPKNQLLWFIKTR